MEMMTSSNSLEQGLLISIVIPVYCEERNLAPLLSSLESIAKQLPKYEWEFIFVNDGSVDSSLTVLNVLCSRNPRCRAIDLSRNFGKEVALSAGVAYASGQAIISMDADLQHPPKYIPQFIHEWEAGYEVVTAIKKKNLSQSQFRRFAGWFFYKTMAHFSDLEVVAQSSDFRLIDRKVADALLTITERQRSFRGLIDWLGFRKKTIEIIVDPRHQGAATYSLPNLISLAVNSFISHSTVPLKLVGILGIFVTCGSALLLSWMLITRFVIGDKTYFSTLAFFIIGNSFLFGVVMSILGVIALYIRKIYRETINRPLFAIRETIGFANKRHSIFDKELTLTHEKFPNGQEPENLTN
jgi:glycosyltransferase involved in cell wall biosynthesis